MMRFILYVSMAFITAFVGVTWAARGFPVQLFGPVSVGRLQPTLTTTFGDNSSEKKREALVEQQLQDPENAKRNPLRADALQAATGFALSPCDKTMKANLVVPRGPMRRHSTKSGNATPYSRTAIRLSTRPSRFIRHRST
jgi:hypothetical protein